MQFSLGSLFGRREKRADSLENPSISLSDPRAFLAIWGGSGSSSGLVVNEKLMLSVPAIWAAVNFLSGTIAALPFQLFRKGADGSPEKSDKDSLYGIVHDVVNSNLLTSYQWRKQGMARVFTKGRWLTFVERNKAGRVMNLWPMKRSQTRIKIEDGKLRYFYTLNGQEVIYEAEEVIDIYWLLEEDGITEISPLDRMGDAIGLAKAVENYAAKFFQNGGVPPLAMEAPAMSAAAASRASKDVENTLQNANDEQRNVLIMPAGHTLKPIGFDPEKSQMKEARQFAVLEVARIYGIGPVFLQDLTFGTNTNTEQQDLFMTKHTLTQWLECIEQEANCKIFGRTNRSRYVEFNVDGLLRGDFASRTTGYSNAVQNGVLTPNEARAMENRPAMPGGDKLYINSASVPLEQAQNGQGAKPAAPADSPVTEPDQAPVQEDPNDQA